MQGRVHHRRLQVCTSASEELLNAGPAAHARLSIATVLAAQLVKRTRRSLPTRQRRFQNEFNAQKRQLYQISTCYFKGKKRVAIIVQPQLLGYFYKCLKL